MTTKTKEDSLTITVEEKISYQRIYDLLVGGLDSACGSIFYWAHYKKRRIGKKPVWLKKDDVEFGGIWAPLSEGGYIILDETPLVGCEIQEDELKDYKLDLDAIKRGIQIMADKYPRHFGDFVNENDDATTSDVFVQCCVFGEVVYG